MTAEITDQNFDELVIRPGKTVVLDLWAEWCPPCLKLGPIMEEIAKDFEGKALIGKVNVDRNPEISVQFGIRNIPAILYFRNGKLVDKQIGFVPKETLVQKLAAQL
ncbi:MAG TPA: thioredoxin [Bacteroidia bacterium]|nr:thioredoxin [Bacteroidia bacterium]